VVYAQLWGKMIDLPTGLPMHTNELKTLLNDRLPRVQDRDGFPEQADGAHDALADARHVKVRYDWIMARSAENSTTYTDGTRQVDVTWKFTDTEA
jgi:hypothetical protein